MIKTHTDSGSLYNVSPGTSGNMNLFITTGRGLEPFLAEEIQELAQEHKLTISDGPNEAVAGVSLEAPFETVVALNFGLTTASRVTWTLLEGYAPNGDAVYSLTSSIPWEKIFDVEKTFKVEAHCKDGFTTNSMFLALKVKDAIADSFRNKFGSRPSVDPKNPDVTVLARLQGKKITIAVDTSGETLSNHGYRVGDGRAPLRENLAASMIRATGWPLLAKSLRTDCEPVYLERNAGNAGKEADSTKRRIPLRLPVLPTLLDPMCGTGTLPIEAALLLLNKKPNSRRGYFAFDAMACFHGKEFAEIRSSLSKKFENAELSEDAVQGAIKRYTENLKKNSIDFECASSPIIASDIDAHAITSTRRNAEAAGVNKLIDLGRCSFFEGDAPAKCGIMVMNPPYGERLEDDEAVAVMYEKIGNTLKHHFRGWMTWLISNNTPALKRIGLRPTRKVSLYNGPLACQYQQYILY